MFKYFDAFSGIGGFSLGIQKALPIARCIGYSEINKSAIQIYEKHYPNHINYGDITGIKPEQLPNFNLFCFGFPCQDVSISGKRTGLCGTRSGLFFEAMRIIREKQPRIIFAENVPGLLSSNKGWDFARVLIEMDDAGYDVEWINYNSKNHVAQNRNRVYLVGHIRGKSWREIFPLRKNDIKDERTYTKEQGDGEWLWDINSNKRQDSQDIEREKQDNRRTGSSGLEKIGHIGNNDGQGTRVYSTEGIAPSIVANGGGLGGKTGLYEVIVHSTQTRNPNRPSLQYSSGGSGHLQKQDGTAYCLDTACSQVIEIPNISSKRIYDINPVEISSYLNKYLKQKGISKETVANKLGLPFSLVEHFFRPYGSISLPDKDIWLKLKEILNFDDKYDKQMTIYTDYINSYHQGDRVYSTEMKSPSLNTSVIPKIIAIKTQRTEECKQIRKEHMQNGKDWCPRQGKELTIREDNLMNTLTASWEINQSVFDTEKTRIRRLTPLECERLQGFPDFWTKEGIDEKNNIVQISDSQRYACIGNSVTVPVISAIIEAMKLNL